VKLATKLRRYKIAKEEFLLDYLGDMKCDGCGRYDRPLSISHTISRARCEQIGQPELYYDKDNFEMMCYYDSGACHETWESATLVAKKKLLNFDKMMLKVERHDPEAYNKILLF
jgi:hypothetical protein